MGKQHAQDEAVTSERSALLLSAGAAATVGCVGVLVFFQARSHAILLDGLFNVSYFVAALLTLKIATLVHRPDTEKHPFGFIYFEPLINGAKGIMILGVSLIALFDAMAALLTGGHLIGVGPAIGYGVFATVVCAATAVLLRRAYGHNRSPLVETDAASWSINALVSGIVLLSFCAIPVIESLGWMQVVPYVDPLLVSAIVLVLLGVPVRMAWTALRAFLNFAPLEDIRRPVIKAVEGALAQFPAESFEVRMIRPGRLLLVSVYVRVAKDHPTAEFSALDKLREEITAAVRHLHEGAVVDVLFFGGPR